jgi:hypothetical protein
VASDWPQVAAANGPKPPVLMDNPQISALHITRRFCRGREPIRCKWLTVLLVSQKGIVHAKASAKGEAGVTEGFVAKRPRAERAVVTLNFTSWNQLERVVEAG